MAASTTSTDDSLPWPDIDSSEVHHWPIVRAYAERIGLRAVLNRVVGEHRRAFDPGLMVLAMVVDTLSGRSPLYHLESFFEGKDTQLLLGEHVDASVFNDDNAGAALDLLYAAGTQRIYAEVSMAAFRAFELSTDKVHFDTTSVSVYGDYRCNEEDADEAARLQLTYGHSKDKRPDLKQFVVSMLCVGGNVPIMGQCEHGNASDKTLNNTLLSTISKRLKDFGIEEQAFTYIADSALVTPDNLATMGQDIRFITRLPATYAECARVIDAALEAEQWHDIGRLAYTAPTKNRPGAHYRLWDSEVTLYEQRYRAVVVHSSAHDQRRLKRLERELTASKLELNQQAKALHKEVFYCLADAQAAAAKARAERTAYHTLEVRTEQRPQYARGRPKKDGSRTLKAMHYGLVVSVCEDQALTERRRAQAGCFVMLTNVPKDGEGAYDAKTILSSYKEQHGIERNFGFLKDDAIVNAIFLKTPERIEALGLILILSLLIWRLIEHQMRAHLAATDTTLPGWNNQPTQRPTGYMVTMKFKGIVVLRLGNQRRLARPLSPARLAFLNALGVSADIFTYSPRDG